MADTDGQTMDSGVDMGKVEESAADTATVAFNPPQPVSATLCQVGRERMTMETEPGASRG